LVYRPEHVAQDCLAAETLLIVTLRPSPGP
jgi:hypothetical protein